VYVNIYAIGIRARGVKGFNTAVAAKGMFGYPGVKGIGAKSLLAGE
tara:strand:- start:66469 stop:66606 length:138 start_codon:yes stop_codon:yes gene_type:complete